MHIPFWGKFPFSRILPINEHLSNLFMLRNVLSGGFKKSKFCCFQGPNECLIPVPVRYVPNTFYAIKLEIWGCLLLYQNCVKHTCKLLTLNDVRLKNPSDDVNNIRTPLFSFFSQSNPNEIIISEGDRCDYVWYIWDTDVK